MGGVMSGEEAKAIGLADLLAPDRPGLDALTDEVARRLAAGGPKALAATKALLNRIDGSEDRDAVLRGAELSASVLATPEAQAALRNRVAPKTF
jgi:methylglutaconyl-CoA hydratase